MNQILINNQNVLIKEYEGKRVITFKDIDTVSYTHLTLTTIA